jgi:phosphopantothenoylcysteine decarboxylase/phosphopantothenate--cysteine ligase
VLAGRHIILGVTGGVAAYKAAILARRLGEEGATVRVMMTETAIRFVGEATMAAVSGDHPIVGFFDEAEVSPHTELAAWADAMVIAPATANTIAKLATGASDNVVVATALATTAPRLIAPAMHTAMWENPATRRNVAALVEYGDTIIGPVAGPLAGGDTGPGRMAEPEAIVAAVAARLVGDLEGWRVLVTAGGTREAIDPVRFIGNRSSGLMGSAIAREAARRGATVTLVTTAPPAPRPGLEVIAVETAAEMADAVWSRAGATDVAIMAAAVADFRPRRAGETKLRRRDGVPAIELEPTPDVLAGVAAMESRPFLVGFAAETGSLDGAAEKARDKGIDLLVANDVTRPGSGFATETNEVTLYTPDGAATPWPLLSKAEVARRLWDQIVAMHDAG